MMAIVDNRNVSLEGRKIGVHPVVTIILMLILLILLSVPTYHMTNGLGSVFAPNGGWLIYVAAVVAFATATAEPILVQSIYHNEGTNRNGKKDISGRVSLGAYIVFVTAMGGWSHGINNGQADIKSNAHGIQTQSFTAELKAAENSYHDKMSRAKDKDKAAIGAAFQKQKAGIYRSYSKHASSAVVQTSEASRIASTLLYCLFSFIVSILTVAYSRFILKFSLSITEIPIIDYISKLGLDWTTGKAEGSNNIIDHGTGRKTQLRGDLPEPKIQLNNANIGALTDAQNQEPASTQNRPTQNRPALDATGVADENSVSGRTLNQNTSKGDLNADIYAQLKREVLSQKLPPTVRAIKAWLRSEKVGDTDKTRSTITDNILSKMRAENVLILNPEQGKTNKIVAKYVLNADYSKAVRREVSKASKSDTPNWIDEAVEMKHSNVPYFCFEDEKAGVYRLAILSPDRQQTLCEFATLDADEMGEELRPDENGENSEKYQAFLNSLKQYRKLQK